MSLCVPLPIAAPFRHTEKLGASLPSATVVNLRTTWEREPWEVGAEPLGGVERGIASPEKGSTAGTCEKKGGEKGRER